MLFGFVRFHSNGNFNINSSRAIAIIAFVIFNLKAYNMSLIRGDLDIAFTLARAADINAVNYGCAVVE